MGDTLFIQTKVCLRENIVVVDILASLLSLCSSRQNNSEANKNLY